ncbi:enolase C-terminal domain-like protein [Planobacterium oryzisoli]|uniref:Chloromuconate cycloisomerase n=1 Tax=Planobacterium oryzisoli TaxID=2771435 RepID=A0A930YWR6_9FLAO|nr:enolase C-terminal domain-like protein [Planobacterium oryzisoli]MBF5027838.1 chloromuconate cycloisomerase [Planobacterium oryzisoli]
MRSAFVLAHGSYTERSAITVTVTDQRHHGYGELVVIDYYGLQLQDLCLELELVAGYLKDLVSVHPMEIYAYLCSLPIHSFVRSAVDCACWDYYGKSMGKLFSELNNIPRSTPLQSSFTIGVTDSKTQLQQANQSAWNFIKFKCDREYENLLRDCGLIQKKFAIDFNGSLNRKQYAELLDSTWCAALQYIEQPVPATERPKRRQRTTLPVIADEAFQEASDLKQIAESYDGINIKLLKVGGLTPALLKIQQAKQLGLKVMIGCMTESTVGISAAAVLAPLCDYADLDGANLIANDYAYGSTVQEGLISISTKPGLGIGLL